jgi:hypothetical protein
MLVLTRVFLDMYKRTCESSKIGLKSYRIVELQLVKILELPGLS